MFISINSPNLVTQWVLVQKIYTKMYPISCTNTHHDVTDLINHGMVKIQKFEYLENGTWLFYERKKSLTCALYDKLWEVIVFQRRLPLSLRRMISLHIYYIASNFQLTIFINIIWKAFMVLNPHECSLILFDIKNQLQTNFLSGNIFI